MNGLHFLKKYGIFILLGMILTLVIVVAFTEPHHITFPLAHQFKRVLSLFFGIFYGMLANLLSGIPLIAIFVGIILTMLFWGIWQLWRGRRYPALIPLTAVIGANILFFGAPQFLDVGRLTEPIVICEDYFITGNIGFRVVRYPIETRLRDDAQTFILLSDDGGTTWRQIFQAYAVNPRISRCDNILAGFGDGTTWSIELEVRRDNYLENDHIRYITRDGGKTFERQDS